MKRFVALAILCASFPAHAQVSQALQSKIDKMASEVEPKVIEWRRHFHQYPELSNREFKTAEKVAEHLRALGIETTTGIAHTGVVGLLKGAKPGPVIALRADMDALPVTERNNLPFKSTVTATYAGMETGVMHACGHDSHVAILMGVAEILAQNRDQLRGTVKFIFQPAEEGPPPGEEGGAELMVKEGVLENPKVDVIFGMHIQSISKLGTISYKEGGLMAASDWFTIKVKGRQAHGAAPWMSVDPVVISAQIINALQTIVSRQMDLTQEPVVVTVARINAGIRENIIPEEAVMSGTIRTLDKTMQQSVHEKIRRIATGIAETAGAVAEVTFDGKTPVTYNDPQLTALLVPALERAAGKDRVVRINPVTGAEDFAFFQEKVPGFFFFVGARPADMDPATTPSHHTPDFMIDESALLTGLKAMLNVTLHYMFTAGK
ncbi:MAG: amidohydrolase [Cyclobacteriaceae bacterium]|nr:amidohydrolase [Cyclobacteriaceae bacterium]